MKIYKLTNTSIENLRIDLVICQGVQSSTKLTYKVYPLTWLYAREFRVQQNLLERCIPRIFLSCNILKLPSIFSHKACQFVSNFLHCRITWGRRCCMLIKLINNKEQEHGNANNSYGKHVKYCNHSLKISFQHWFFNKKNSFHHS